jgi:hypothetical protein
MDALASRSGIIDKRTDIAKAEVYLLAEPGFSMTEKEVRTICDDFGYGLRTYELTTEKKWEDVSGANE